VATSYVATDLNYNGLQGDRQSQWRSCGKAYTHQMCL